jgi:hypothetical protein
LVEALKRLLSDAESDRLIEVLGLEEMEPAIGLVIEPGFSLKTECFLAIAFEWSNVIGIDAERMIFRLTLTKSVSFLLFRGFLQFGSQRSPNLFSFGIGHLTSELM